MPHPKFIDEAGKKYERLRVLRSVKKKGIGTVWLCLCNCGNTKIVNGHELRSGRVKSCGCLFMPDLIGKKYGKLTVIKETGRDKHNQRKWSCKCECGKRIETTTASLSMNKRLSCGCYRFSRKGRCKIRQGYIEILAPWHPNSNSHGYVKEHILKMVSILKRPLKRGEIIHHKNGIRDDNRIENLELWTQGHPPGQRVSDMIDYCTFYLSQYAPQKLNLEN